MIEREFAGSIGVLLVVTLSAVAAGCNRSLQRPTRDVNCQCPGYLDRWGNGSPLTAQGEWWDLLRGR